MSLCWTSSGSWGRERRRCVLFVWCSLICSAQRKQKEEEWLTGLLQVLIQVRWTGKNNCFFSWVIRSYLASSAWTGMTFEKKQTGCLTAPINKPLATKVADAANVFLDKRSEPALGFLVLVMWRWALDPGELRPSHWSLLRALFRMRLRWCRFWKHGSESWNEIFLLSLLGSEGGKKSTSLWVNASLLFCLAVVSAGMSNHH